MRGPARYILFVFAIIAVAVIFSMWKKQDRTAAEKILKDDYLADITVNEYDFIVGCDSDKLVDLEAFSALLNRLGEPTILDLTACPNLASFRGVERLTSLKSLIAIDCPKLISAEGVSGLPELTEIVLTDSQSFSDASNLRNLRSLTTIDMSGCLDLKELDVSALPKLQNLYVSRCRKLAAVDLSSSANLQQFYADGCAALSEVKGLGKLRELTDLDVSNCDSLRKLEGVAMLDKLVVLDIRNVNLNDFSEIGTLSNLRVLRLGGQDHLESLEPFSGLTGLKEIHLEACPNFHSLKGLPASVSQYAGFTYCPKLTSLSGISVATGLEQIDLSGCESLTDVAELATLKNLVQLSLTKCRQVTDINHVEGLEKLAIVLLGGSGVVPASIKDLKRAMRQTVFDFLLAEQ